MSCGTGSTLYILPVSLNVKNIPHNIANPTHVPQNIVIDLNNVMVGNDHKPQVQINKMSKVDSFIVTADGN